ncbi:hypothetical protein ANN_04922 [Periplaneta americana]|uniref:Histone-lysine N-methyltransferase SETMAR n=1 Tax=Periplaneta americana TaxID=6978 RepID=A0ABQ8TBB7_PERAM|nr:hypothetical protein ANN_04922 [Periplaneta americana]
MATVFCKRKGILLVEFLERNATINAERYCNTLTNLKSAIQNKRRGMLSSGMIFLHDNAWLQTVHRTATKLQEFNWEVSDHPPYSPDLAPSDYHGFMHIKTWLGSKRFFYDRGISKLVKRYDKCLNCLSKMKMMIMIARTVKKKSSSDEVKVKKMLEETGNETENGLPYYWRLTVILVLLQCERVQLEKSLKPYYQRDQHTRRNRKSPLKQSPTVDKNKIPQHKFYEHYLPRVEFSGRLHQEAIETYKHKNNLNRKEEGLRINKAWYPVLKNICIKSFIQQPNKMVANHNTSTTGVDHGDNSKPRSIQTLNTVMQTVTVPVVPDTLRRSLRSCVPHH